MCQGSLGGEPTCGVGMEKGTDEALCCDGGHESQISDQYLVAITDWRTTERTENCYGISLREMAALTEASKELAAASELESEVVFYPRLKPFVGLDLQKDNQTC